MFDVVEIFVGFDFDFVENYLWLFELNLFIRFFLMYA